MRKRSILVPVNATARTLFDTNENSASDLLSVELNDKEFDDLWLNGFFSSINKIANINIDDYEDDSIEDIQIISKVLDEYLINNTNIKKMPKINEIITLFKEAINRRTAIYFYM